MPIDFNKLSLAELGHGLSSKDFSARELSKWYLDRINEKDSDINAYLEVFDDVLKQADEADLRLGRGKGSALLGIPIAIKDNILIEGRSASAGSKILENYKAAYSATVVHRLKDAGAVFLGRTNMDEFAMGSSTEHSAFTITKNPHDDSRVPGGSSGGSAAAVASAMAPVALGSDTGGSIRQPASFCGCVGLKSTYGTVSRYGLIALGSSLDQIGPIGRTVEDVELVYGVIKGEDAMDSTSIGSDRYPKDISKNTPHTIGVPRSFFEDGINKEVLLQFDKKLTELKSKGYTILDIELPNVKYSLSAYYIIMPAEASTNLARLDGVRYGLHVEGKDLFDDYVKSRGRGFGKEVRRRILLGTYVLSAGYYDTYYGRADTVRKLIKDDFSQAFDVSKGGVDVIATPTTPTVAFGIGEKSDPLSMYLADIFTVPANITGMPALSVPMGVVKDKGVELPVGFQIIAPELCEDRLFSVGKSVEQVH